jgi:uncharacterized protein with HEPN domain
MREKLIHGYFGVDLDAVWLAAVPVTVFQCEVG